MCAMFIREAGTRITTEAILEALANPHDRQILALAQAQPVDAQRVIETTGIPKSSVYRRIDRLKTLGLLETVDGPLRDGHAIDRYRARLDSLSMVVQDGRIRARARRRQDAGPLVELVTPPQAADEEPTEWTPAATAQS